MKPLTPVAAEARGGRGGARMGPPQLAACFAKESADALIEARRERKGMGSK